MLELSEIHQEKHVLESDLQSVVNEVTSLEATKRGLEHKAIEYTAQLDVLQTHTIAEAEALLTTLPTTISNHKHQRQDRVGLRAERKRRLDGAQVAAQGFTAYRWTANVTSFMSG